MMIAELKGLMFRAALAGGLCLFLAGVAAAQVVTTSFQNGVDGYTGTFDRRINDRFYDEDGGGVGSYYLDGFSTGGSPDEQGLIRFDEIMGTEPGQIPAGATILDARLILTTGTAGNAHSAGPYGVAGLLQAFDSSSTCPMNWPW